jgi:hypothetical protein
MNNRSTVYAQNQYSFPNLAAFLLGGALNNPVQVITSLPLNMNQEKWYFGSTCAIPGDSASGSRSMQACDTNHFCHTRN